MWLAWFFLLVSCSTALVALIAIGIRESQSSLLSRACLKGLALSWIFGGVLLRVLVK